MSETSLDLTIHHQLFGRAQHAIELVIEAATEKFIGLMGTSVGGLHAATAAGHFQRVSAAFVIAAGAPVADILAYTDQGALRSVRERRIRKFGFEDQLAYRDALSAVFDWEPLSYAAEARKKPLGIIVVRGDETVPTAFQEQLRKAWQPTTDFSVSGFPWGSHMVGIVQAWWLHADDILDFFNRHAQI
ncbi:MAG: prolyl oligopeptidase family serine peptidase [Chromatocurvus sp.]